MRTKGRSRVIEILLVAVLAGASALPAFAVETHEFNVPAEDARDAIREFASQAHVQILAAGENVKDKQFHAVSGTYSTDQGLHILLADSGLAPQYVGDRSIALVTASQVPASTSDQPKEGKRSSSDAFRLAQVDQGASQGTSSVASQKLAAGVSVEEVVVTAQKKSERLLDVPVSVTVLDTQSLAENDLNRIQDYYSTVPGLNLASSPGAAGGGRQNISIRGVSSTAFGTPTVALLIDDVPFGSSTSVGEGMLTYPDIDPSDLARIEVLKGPQGTLYGADSLGGLIKYVTLDPSTSGFSGRVQVLGNGVVDGGMGYGVRGAVNVPLSDTLAVRVSGFSRRDPGYIDNLTTGEDNVNSADVYGGHVAALWRPLDDVSLKLSALVQDTHSHGGSYIDTDSSFQPVLGDLKQTGLPGTGIYDSAVRLYTATLNAKLAGVDIVSITGWGENRLDSVYDLSESFGYYANKYFGVLGSDFPYSNKNEKFTQEIRLSSTVGSWLSWLVGGFCTHEAPTFNETIDANSSVTGAYLGTVLVYHYPYKFSEHSVFGDVTFHITDRFDLQLGARESWSSQTYQLSATGLATEDFYNSPSPYFQPKEQADNDAFTYLVTPEFKIAPDTMAYARIASGYQIGGPNIATTNGGPPTYKPSTTTNYELGIKTSLYDHRLTFDASTYYIDWRDIQVLVRPLTSAFSYYINGSRAKSEGVEFSVQVRPVQSLQISASGSFGDAELTQDLPAHSSAYGLSGDRLPYDSRFSGTLSIDQDLMHMGQATAFIGASASYVGLRYGEFTASAAQTRSVFPDYTVVNAHTGIRNGSWLFNLFVNNLANQRGVTGGGTLRVIGSTGYGAEIIQPRTVGLSVSKDF